MFEKHYQENALWMPLIIPPCTRQPMLEDSQHWTCTSLLCGLCLFVYFFGNPNCELMQELASMPIPILTLYYIILQLPPLQ